MLSLLRELVEMESPDLEGNGDEGMDDREKSYTDEEHAKEHSQEFISRAKSVLQHNRKPADEKEVADLAKKFAKDYYQSIIDAIDSNRFNNNQEPEEPEGREDEFAV